MKEEELLEEIAMCILQYVNDEKYPDLKSVIVDVGGVNRRIFSPKNFLRQRGSNLVRFLIDMLLRITEDDFRNAMEAVVEKMIGFANNECDITRINAEHTKKLSETFHHSYHERKKIKPCEE